MLYFLAAIICIVILSYQSMYKAKEEINYLKKTIEISSESRVPIWHRLVEKTNTEGEKYQTWFISVNYYNNCRDETFNIVLKAHDERKYLVYQTDKTQMLIQHKQTKEQIYLYRTAIIPLGFENDWGRRFNFSLSREEFEELCFNGDYTFILSDFGGDGKQVYELNSNVSKQILNYLKRFYTVIKMKKNKIRKITAI